jgi:hypothetical protein
LDHIDRVELHALIAGAFVMDGPVRHRERFARLEQAGGPTLPGSKFRAAEDLMHSSSIGSALALAPLLDGYHSMVTAAERDFDYEPLTREHRTRMYAVVFHSRGLNLEEATRLFASMAVILTPLEAVDRVELLRSREGSFWSLFAATFKKKTTPEKIEAAIDRVTEDVYDGLTVPSAKKRKLDAEAEKHVAAAEGTRAKS